MNALFNDIRYALRLLAKTPGFTLVAIVTLALGIGANTAMFSVIHSVLLRPLPYLQADRLTTIWNDYGSGGQSLPAVSPPDFRDYQQRCRLFEQLAAATGGNGAAVDFGTTEGDERPQQHRMNHRKHRRVGPNPQRQRHNRHQSEARRLGQ